MGLSGTFPTSQVYRPICVVAIIIFFDRVRAGPAIKSTLRVKTVEWEKEPGVRRAAHGSGWHMVVRIVSGNPTTKNCIYQLDRTEETIQRKPNSTFSFWNIFKTALMELRIYEECDLLEKDTEH